MEDITALSFFQCEDLKNQIAASTDADGAITEEQVNQLVAANTQSIVKLGRLVNFIKLCEAKIEICKQKKDEVNTAQKRAETVVAGLKERLAYWAKEQPHNPMVGEYVLHTRMSKQVVLKDGFNNPIYGKIVETFQADKQKIREDIEAGIVIEGAKLVEILNLQIKG